jgi:hypothetical protein
VAEQALAGLDGELRRRLGNARLGDFPNASVDSLTLDPISFRGEVDAARLRGLIAERLVDKLLSFGIAGGTAREVAEWPAS